MNNSTPSSPPCFAHELVPGDMGFEVCDAQTRLDVARWRKGERQRLIAARLAVPVSRRAAVAKQIIATLDQLVDPGAGPVIGLYWPFRGELDLRGWMRTMSDKGAQVALPVVVEKARPLVFRRWSPQCKMERGVWNIPIPADDQRVIPDIVIAPLVGVDPAGYRLGYGGGFYDRTLAALNNDPLVIGCGHPVARIDTIFPLPHDVPMNRVLLGDPE
ncbi:MAG: 5-formyltetrahydrofolate cyclo-ligase [Rhizobiaceae bacterium]